MFLALSRFYCLWSPVLQPSPLPAEARQRADAHPSTAPIPSPSRIRLSQHCRSLHTPLSQDKQDTASPSTMTTTTVYGSLPLYFYVLSISMSGVCLPPILSTRCQRFLPLKFRDRARKNARGFGLRVLDAAPRISSANEAPAGQLSAFRTLNKLQFPVYFFAVPFA